MTREDYQMGKNIIEEIEKYKRILSRVYDKNRCVHISLNATHEYEKVWLNNPDTIGEIEQKKLNHMVRDYLKFFLENKVEKLEKELDEL